MTLISTVTVGAGGAASIDFTSIPQTGTDLVVMYSTREATNTISAYFRINGNSGTIYSTRRLLGDGATATSTTSSASGQILFSAGEPSTYTANTFNNVSVYLPNYTSATSKSISIDGVSEQNNTTAYQTLTAGLAADNNPITAVNIVAAGTGFVQYSTASLYIIDKSGATGASVA